MNCPRCRREGVEELAEEVDIGLGVQRFVGGVDCPDCGLVVCCPGCGHWDVGKHYSWCLDKPE